MISKFKITNVIFFNERRMIKQMDENSNDHLKKFNKVVNAALAIAGLMIAGSIVLLAVYFKYFY